ncbi:hypothetical protein ACFVWX_28045 [Streptomyces sp. NPDC058220]|uniref:hypothetical protein n=1 Tax=unclassified Streptomyces TaxID=2593676 RepID=UPI0036541B9A
MSTKTAEAPGNPVAPVGRKTPAKARILRTELRRSTALWLGGLLLVGSLAGLELMSGPWTKGAESWTAQWTSTAWWERFLLVILWPLAVAGGAVQGLRDHRSGTSELLSATSRPPWHRAARTAGASALTLSVAYLLVFGYGGVRALVNDGYTGLSWLPILLVGALAMVAGAWLGMGVTRTLPSALTPPVLAVAALMTSVLLSDVVLKDVVPNGIMLLTPSLSLVHSEFLTVSWRVNAGQALWLLGVAATGFLLLVAGKPRARLLALLPMVLGAAVALPVLPSDPERNYVVDTAAAELVCDGRVCVTRLHEQRLAALTGPAEEALRLLGRLPDPPSAVHESVDAWPRDTKRPRTADVVPVDFEAQALDHTTGDESTRTLLGGAGTAPCLEAELTDPTEEELRAYDETRVVRELAARTVAAAWFTGDLKPLAGTLWLRADVDALTRPAWNALRALPADEQRLRIAALRTAALSCDGDLLTVLADGGPR